jgi:DNA-binding MarR family transcriptional regulator
MRFVRLLKATASSAAGPDRSALLLLWPLLHDGPMRLCDLAEAKGADASTVSRQAAQLVGSGLVRRTADPADRRARRLDLTRSGRELCEQMISARRAAVDAALRDWDDEKVATFTRLFREFNHAVEDGLTAPA